MVVEANTGMEWTTILDALVGAILDTGVCENKSSINNLSVSVHSDSEVLAIKSATFFFKMWRLFELFDDSKLVVSFEDYLPHKLGYPQEGLEVLKLYVGKAIDDEESTPSCTHSLHPSVNATFSMSADSFILPDGIHIDTNKGNFLRYTSNSCVTRNIHNCRGFEVQTF